MSKQFSACSVSTDLFEARTAGAPPRSDEQTVEVPVEDHATDENDAQQKSSATKRKMSADDPLLESKEGSSDKPRTKKKKIIKISRRSDSSYVSPVESKTTPLPDNGSGGEDISEDDEVDVADIFGDDDAGDKDNEVEAMAQDISEITLDSIFAPQSDAEDDGQKLSFMTAYHMLIKYHATTDFYNVGDASTFVNMWLTLSNSAINDLLKMSVRHKGLPLGSLDTEFVKKYPGLPFDQLQDRIGGLRVKAIRSHAALIKRLRGMSQFISFRDGKYMIGNSVIFSLRKNAYDYEFNYSVIGNLLNVKIACVDTVDQFLFMLFLTSNGVFSMHKGIVAYMPTELPVSKEPVRDRFVVSPDIARARSKFLEHCASLVEKRKFTVLNAHTVILDPPKLLEPYRKRILDMIMKFYNPVINGTNGDCMAKNIKLVRSMSQANKGWRASINRNKWFTATPEFDYVAGKGINFYSSNLRNKILFPDVTKGSTLLDNSDTVYDLTGIKKNAVIEIVDFKAIHCMWTPSLSLIVNRLPLGRDYDFYSVQRHSLDVIIVPKVSEAPVTRKDIVKKWYLVSLYVMRSEVTYMSNMVTGLFPLSSEEEFTFQAAEMQSEDSMVDDVITMFKD